MVCGERKVSSGIGREQIAIVGKNREFDQTLSPNFHGRREEEIEEEEEEEDRKSAGVGGR